MKLPIGLTEPAESPGVVVVINTMAHVSKKVK